MIDRLEPLEGARRAVGKFVQGVIVARKDDLPFFEDAMADV